MSTRPNDTNFIERAREISLGKTIQVIGLYNYMLAAGFLIVSIEAEAYVLLTILGTAAWFLGSII
ncbi:hypothetical protein Halru_1846 [Halovivax ruber XH-70]|uniref:Uncharacterized protein n=1 Tax=Halovivax ruber (strain DSM 18193 / JCM 13892 / XH-70) TaxID=797302 RepID=L0IA30_HALRX|nr:hypothetical protein [Halovivax ruber]AGB16445.1 hypothetical protein Halru_1846 [Halovivax ruber XH-70]